MRQRPGPTGCFSPPASARFMRNSGNTYLYPRAGRAKRGLERARPAPRLPGRGPRYLRTPRFRHPFRAYRRACPRAGTLPAWPTKTLEFSETCRARAPAAAATSAAAAPASRPPRSALRPRQPRPSPRRAPHQSPPQAGRRPRSRARPQSPARRRSLVPRPRGPRRPPGRRLRARAPRLLPRRSRRAATRSARPSAWRARSPKSVSRPPADCSSDFQVADRPFPFRGRFSAG
jgi:hypothetical protein